MSTQSDLSDLAEIIARAHFDGHETGPCDLTPEALDRIAETVAVLLTQARTEGHVEGYETARADLTSGAFVGGPTYEVLRDSFTGRRIAQEALTTAADELATVAPMLRDQYVRVIRLYAAEPWRLESARADRSKS